MIKNTKLVATMARCHYNRSSVLATLCSVQGGHKKKKKKNIYIYIYIFIYIYVRTKLEMDPN